MAVSAPGQARLYQRCALGRLEDAQILLKADRTTGAMYLAGYGIECILKALILSSVAPKVEEKILDSFRGGKAHDYRWLQERYFENGGPGFPKEITRTFLIVGDWSTSLRYLPRTMKITEARDFLKAANSIVLWVNSRI